MQRLFVWYISRLTSCPDSMSAYFNHLLPTKLRTTVATGYLQRYNRIHWQQRCSGKEAEGGCPSAPSSGARQQPEPAPASSAGAVQPMLMEPAEARREARSTRQSPTAKTKAVEDLEAQSPKFPLNLNQIQKCSSRTKASVEALTANRSQKQVGSYLICKIEYSRRIFRLSWYQLSTNRTFKTLLISIVKNRTQQPETASNFYLICKVKHSHLISELIFPIYLSLILLLGSVTCCRQN